ncbi:MAG TPA: lytic transglycosylase domain-containing protein [Bacteroidetes bacterium]|nr:lytic transglycosylase domain-containing protein [Bacteroidota bacterium]HEX03610.1 lytic transglycosylase domain-containing protein [Bacteroidota bacterium]
MYNSMYTEVLGDQLAGQGALGITDMIYRQLMEQKGVEPFSDEINESSPSLYQSPPNDLLAQMTASHTSTRADFETLAIEAADRYDLDPRLVQAVIRAESEWDSTAVSSAGAMGLMQLMPDTATELGVMDAFDAEQNIDGGARYLRQMLDRYDGELSVALAAYNAGPSAVDKHGGVPPFEETRQYVQKILSWLAMPGSAEPLIRDEATTQTAREFIHNLQSNSGTTFDTSGRNHGS